LKIKEEREINPRSSEWERPMYQPGSNQYLKQPAGARMQTSVLDLKDLCDLGFQLSIGRTLTFNISAFNFEL
jgi:hypothetical protein